MYSKIKMKWRFLHVPEGIPDNWCGVWWNHSRYWSIYNILILKRVQKHMYFSSNCNIYIVDKIRCRKVKSLVSLNFGNSNLNWIANINLGQIWDLIRSLNHQNAFILCPKCLLFALYYYYHYNLYAQTTFTKNRKSTWFCIAEDMKCTWMIMLKNLERSPKYSRMEKRCKHLQL